MQFGTEEGAARVELRIPRPPTRLVLSSFVQPEVIRPGGLRAHRGGRDLEVRAFRDERGFTAWEIGTGRGAGPVTVEYSVAPGAVEEIRMAGPTGYRFGHAGADFSLVTGRQIFVFPADPPPGSFRVRFALPSGWEVAAPWEPGREPGEFLVHGERPAVRLIDAVLGAGRFESREAAGGRVRILASVALPGQERRAALDRAVDLAEDLAASLGPPRGPWLLFLVPPLSGGDLVSVAPGIWGMGVSVGAGVPTRWLGVGRQIGRACLEARRDAGREEAGWIRESLPTYLTVLHSERMGWRSLQDWMEEFFYETAGREMDLRMAAPRPDPLPREWRGAVLLDRVSRELASLGLASIEQRCRSRAARPGGCWEDLAAGEDLPQELRARLGS